MIAAVGPGERPGPAPTLLSVLHRADALMIHGKLAGPAAPVVPITMAVPRSPRTATMGRAGA